MRFHRFKKIKHDLILTGRTMVLGFLFSMTSLSLMAPAKALEAMDPPASFDYWLMITSTGPGLGRFGHAALVEAEAGLSPMKGNAYTFSVNIQKGAGLHPLLDFILAESQLYGKAESELKKTPFSYVVQAYGLFENRVLVLLPLVLTPSEKAALKDRLEQDLVRPPGDFDVINSNCLTYLLRTLNEVVSAEKKITLSRLTQSMFVSLEALRDIPSAALSRAPFWLPHVQRGNPLLQQPPLVVQPVSRQRQVNFETQITPQVRELGKCLGVRDETIEVIRQSLALVLNEENRQPLDALGRLVANRPQCRSTYHRLLDALVMSLPLPLVSDEVRP